MSLPLFLMCVYRCSTLGSMSGSACRDTCVRECMQGHMQHLGIHMQHLAVHVTESLPLCLSLPEICLSLPVEEGGTRLKADSSASAALCHLVLQSVASAALCPVVALVAEHPLCHLVCHLVARSPVPTAQMSHGTCIIEPCRAYESAMLWI